MNQRSPAICGLQAVVASLLALAIMWGAVACTQHSSESANKRPQPQPNILLITLDTARADAFGFDGGPLVTPFLDSLARQSVLFRSAFATAPMTLPSHVSMFTGLYPSQHGVHENARDLDPALDLLASQLQRAGYRTAAFVSAVPLLSEFGIDAGFDHYDDDLSGRAERPGVETTDAAIKFLEQVDLGPAPVATKTDLQGSSSDSKPLFLWVHYYDPHAPYRNHRQVPNLPTIESAELGTLGKATSTAYLSEIASVDQQAARLVERFRKVGVDLRILIVGDHGESLGEFGERTHGSLLHPAVLRVPLLIYGDPASVPGTEVEVPLSGRRVFGTILHWADRKTKASQPTLFDPPEQVVLAESMQPYLQYGWRPQVAGIDKDGPYTFAWLEGSSADGADLTLINLNTNRPDTSLQASPALRGALRAYPAATLSGASSGADDLTSETRSQLASLGYIAHSIAPQRQDAPRPSAMTHLFDALDAASAAFEAGHFRQSLEPLEKVVQADPGNFAAILRLAVAHSLLGTGQAEHYFVAARQLAPDSTDLRHFEGMHLLRQDRFQAAAALFESVLAVEPGRTTSLEGLFEARLGQEDRSAAVEALEMLVTASPSAARLRELGRLQMSMGRTRAAIGAFEQGFELAPENFDASLELGVLYLADHRYQEARLVLDRAVDDATGIHDDQALAMALFKRAQVSALLEEPDLTERIRLAAHKADATTRQLINNERLFDGRRP